MSATLSGAPQGVGVSVPPAPRPGPASGAVWFLVQAGVLVLAGAVWWIASLLFPAGTMPSPAETFVRLGQLALTEPFWEAVGITVLTFALGLLVCIVVGVPLGLAIGSSRFATDSTRLVFDFLRTIPPIAILPLLLLVLGAEFGMVLVLVVCGAIWPILIQSIYAARQGEALLREMAASFRVPRGWFIRHIFVPGALPFVMTGLRVGTTICLLLTITGELLGGAPGVGFEIANAQAFYDNPRMYAYVLVSALLGLAVNAAFWAVQRRVLHWHASVRREAK
jgi:ABC-type nitrate/sulfonate/bicarbonate transport system permease component